MNRILAIALLFLRSAFAAQSQSSQGTSERIPAPKPISALCWLTGGVWTADASKLGPGMQRIETRYAWSENGAYLHFTTHFVFEKGTLNNYDGNLYWDPDKNSLAIWYTDPKGAITQGPMEWSDGVLHITFHGPDFEGKPADLKVEVTRKSDDHYHWAVSEKGASNWKELASLEYIRATEVPHKSN